MVIKQSLFHKLTKMYRKKNILKKLIYCKKIINLQEFNSFMKKKYEQILSCVILFFFSGLVQSYDVNASQGSVQLVEKRMLVWNIGKNTFSNNFLENIFILN